MKFSELKWWVLDEEIMLGCNPPYLGLGNLLYRLPHWPDDEFIYRSWNDGLLKSFTTWTEYIPSRHDLVHDDWQNSIDN